MPWRSDEENCPRNDGGTLTKETDPVAIGARYVCSTCARSFEQRDLLRVKF